MQSIKSKLDTMELLSTEMCGMYSTSLKELKWIKSSIDNYSAFLSDFIEIISCWYDFFSLLNLKNVVNWKKLHIVVSSEKWFCGPVNTHLFFNILDDIDINTDVFCIWKKAFDYFVDKWVNVVWYIHWCSKITDFDILWKYLSNSIDLNLYSDVILSFNLRGKICNYNLYSLDRDDLKEYLSSFWLDFDNIELMNRCNIIWNQEDLQKEVLIQLFWYIVYWAWLQNRVVEIRNRISLTKMRDNVNLMRKIVLSFNKTRQTLLTQKVSELMSKELVVY